MRRRVINGMTGEVDWSKEVLSFKAKTNTTFTVKYSNGGTGELQYSLDNGKTWTVVTHDGNNNINSFVTPTVSAGKYIQWKGNLACPGNTGTTGLVFWSSGSYDVCGNILSLIDETLTEPASLPSACFAKLFDKSVLGSSINNAVKNAENLILPSVISTYCYDHMFYGCTSLETAPLILPALTAPNYCYQYMFYGCTYLYNPPIEIVATSYGVGSCQYMFYNCTRVTYYTKVNATTITTKSCYYMFYRNGYGWSTGTNRPELSAPPYLPATTMASQCYQHIFEGCAHITNIYNVLPASLTIPSSANNCCAEMFYGCKKLVDGGITLAPNGMSQSCFNEFFRECTSLTIPPILPNTTLGTYCYKSMFFGCTKLVNGPILPALTLTQQCYAAMFNGCTKLANIKMMATNISATDCLSNWMSGVGSTGTFTKNAAATWNVTGASGVPTGWTVQTATS